MKKKIIEETKNDLGIYKRIESREKDESDGFVYEPDFNQVNINNYGKYHKGPAKSTTISTNDPRITRPFLRIICGIFLIIGVVFLLIGAISFSIFHILLGTSLVVIISFTYYKAKQPIDELEKELKKYPEYTNLDPKAVRREFLLDMGEAWDDAKKSTFTKENYYRFVRISIPIYSIISLLVFFLIAFLVNLIFGLFILVILILCGFLYYWLISKICKW